MKTMGVFLTLCAISAFLFLPAAVAKPGENGQNGNSFMAKIFFAPQQTDDPDDGSVITDEEGTTPGDTTQDEVSEEDDTVVSSWGKMSFSLRGEAFKFVFNGHGLKAKTSYSLIYLPDPQPGEGLICLGTATANRGGNVHIKDRLSGLCDLPIPSDANYENGAKIALVLSDDVDCDGAVMAEWNPDDYLFGLILISFDDTNCEFVEEVLDNQDTATE